MEVELQLQASEWVLHEGKKLLKEYKACKSKRSRQKLLVKMKHIQGRLHFELRELEKL